ncbi:MAG: outer membrane lipoprotein-sorting protein [Treponema sp.]|nr:outer membrane lipoprotein-sorting protein [Treponema sp.]
MKKIGTLSILLLLPLMAFGESLTGYEIAKKARNIERGKTSCYTAQLILQTKKGGIRTREISLRSKVYDGVKKSLFIFSAPKDVDGVTYLTFEYDSDNDSDKQSESWLYMPAMKKVRRISGTSRQDEFMGSDFTYEDMGERGLNRDDFTLLGEETIEEVDCWKVECTSKDTKEKVPRRILWVRKDNYLPQKINFFNQRGDLERELVCSDIKMVDGYWSIGKMVMRNLLTEHKSTMVLNTIKYDQDLPDTLFTVASIERNLIR